MKKPAQSGPEDHNQFIKDPVAHFLAVPWAAALLRDPAVLGIIVADRRPLASGDERFMRGVMNSATTLRACVTFLMRLPEPSAAERRRWMGGGGGDTKSERPLSPSKSLLQGGGPVNGEDPRRPFLLFNALLDLGDDLCAIKGRLHGGALMAVLDQVLWAAAGSQSHHLLTAQMTTKFLKPVKLPGIVLVRSRVVKRGRRKIYVRGTVEDGDGNLLAESEATLVDTTPGRSSKL